MRILSKLPALLAVGTVLALGATPKPRLARLTGWHALELAVAGHTGWKLPGAEAAAMAEFGLQTLERVSYARSGQQVSLEGYYFPGARGAYGAFTYYRQPEAQALQLGAHRLAVADKRGVLFTDGRWLIRVESAGATPIAVDVARKLARAMPIGADAELSWPDLPNLLPREHQVPGTLHYSEGPAAFAAWCSWLPAQQAGFNQSAEAALASYDVPGQPAGVQMVVLSYPTPQIAAAHQAQLQRSGLPMRRSDSLLMVVHGLSDAAAAPLLKAVNYQVNFTMVPPKFFGLEGLPALILGTFLLCAIIFGASLVVGVITGAGNAVLRQGLFGHFQRQPREALTRLHLQAPVRRIRSGRSAP